MVPRQVTCRVTSDNLGTLERSKVRSRSRKQHDNPSPIGSSKCAGHGVERLRPRMRPRDPHLGRFQGVPRSTSDPHAPTPSSVRQDRTRYCTRGRNARGRHDNQPGSRSPGSNFSHSEMRLVDECARRLQLTHRGEACKPPRGYPAVAAASSRSESSTFATPEGRQRPPRAVSAPSDSS